MKVTIYELLGMVKDGEAPKRIKSEGHYYNYNEIEKDYYEGMGYDYEYLFKNTPNDRLNDEVEIIEDTQEEKKIPEKLSTWFSLEKEQSKNENIRYANYNFETMYEKINEICDCLKSKGE